MSQHRNRPTPGAEGARRAANPGYHGSGIRFLFIPRVELLEDRLVPSGTSAEYLAWQTTQFQIESQEMTASGNVRAQGASFGANAGLDAAQSAYPQYQGQGYTVVIIDTGIDYNHSALGGGWGNRVIAGWDFVNNDADPMDDNGHGTHLAGIVGSSNATYGGVAPQVRFIALKVLDAAGSGSFGNVEKALQWVISHRTQYNIVAISMSLGTGSYTSNPYTFLEDEFTTLKGQGVFIAAAAGNNFYGSGSLAGLSYPAISPLAVSVGAVFNGNYGPLTWSSGAADYSSAPNRVVSLSQRGPALDLFAPGAFITSTYKGGGYVSMAGTSMATPIVAGAAVLIYQELVSMGRADLAHQDYILGVMQNTGLSIVDGDDEADNVVNTGRTYKRLDVAAAMNAVRNLAPTSTATTTPAPANPGNQAPTLTTIPNRILSAGDTLVLLPNATDPNGDKVILSARLTGGTWLNYQLDQQLGLYYGASYYLNHMGQNEKWVLGAGSQWYWVMANGDFRKWSGTIAATLGSSALVARLDPSVYVDPSQLWNATNPAIPASLSWQGHYLYVNVPSGFRGSFTIEVTASDGRLSSARTFTVTVGSQGTVTGMAQQMSGAATLPLEDGLLSPRMETQGLTTIFQESSGRSTQPIQEILATRQFQDVNPETNDAQRNPGTIPANAAGLEAWWRSVIWETFAEEVH